MAEHRGRIRVGTAGWSYADWNGVFYPKPMLRGVDRLTYITRYFDVVEINSTFYAPANASKVEGWLAKTAHAPDFRFAVKLWQRFTHERDSAWTRADEHDVRVALEPLHAAGKLGAVLVQARRMPEAAEYAAPRLVAFESSCLFSFHPWRFPCPTFFKYASENSAMWSAMRST